MLQKEVESKLDGDEHIDESGPALQTKKRPHLSGDALKPPSTKRARVVKNVSKETKAGGRPRSSIARTRQVSEKPRWTVVPGPASIQPAPETKSVDIHPRLWSSSREELVSTYVEIAGSKCTNNISWKFTEMPILILDENSMSLEKIKTDELCMDVIFWREFRYRELPQSVNGSALGVQQQNQKNMLCEPNLPQPSGVKFSIQDEVPTTLSSTKNPVKPAKEPSLRDSSPATEPVAQQAVPTSENVSVATIAESVPKAWRQQPSISQPSARSASPSSSTTSQTSKGQRKKKTQQVTFNLPLESKVSGQLLRYPPPTPPLFQTGHPDSVGLPGELGGPPEPPLALKSLPQTQKFLSSETPTPSASPTPRQHPIREPLERRPTPTTQINSFISSQVDTKPAYKQYPYNSSPPEFTDSGRDFSKTYRFPPLACHPEFHGSKFKIRPVGRPNAQMEYGNVAVCTCSRTRFDPRCPACGVVEAGPVSRSPGGWRAGDKQVPYSHQMRVEPARTAIPLITPAIAMASSASPNFPGGNKVSERQVPLAPRAAHVAHSRVSAPIGNTAHRVNPPQDTIKRFPRPPDILGDARSIFAREALLYAPNSIPPAPSHENINVAPTPDTTTSHPSSDLCEPCSVQTEVEVPSSQKKSKRKGKEKAVAGSDLHATDSPTIDTIMHTVVSSHELGSNQNVAPVPASRKRKSRNGKEKMMEPGGSEEDKSQYLSIEQSRPLKKHKCDQNLSAGKDNKPVETESIAGSPKTRVEDPSPAMQASQAAALASDEASGPDRSNSANHRPSSPISHASEAIKPKKRRGRPPKATQPPLQSTDQPVPLKVEAGEPTIALLSAAASESVTQPHPEAWAKSAAAIVMPLQGKENRMPVSIPDEMQALVDAYTSCVPVGVFATGKQIKDFWGLDLARQEEFGYSFMGFYRILRIWENLEENSKTGIGVNGVESKEAVRGGGIITTRAQWRFRLKWEPGGENWQAIGHDKLSSPWWNPLLKARGLSAVPQPELGDSDEESTEAYREARRRSPNFARRHCFFSQTFFSVLPLHLLAPVDIEMPDSSLSRGWYCQDCGKLNFRYYLRHCRCCSSYCQDKPESGGYAIEIDRLRDPQDNLPMSLPLNELPSSGMADAKVRVWKDKMKTLRYNFNLSMNETPIVVQHVFTCNLKTLQEEPSELLRLVQMHVPLRRATGDGSSNPYFMHSVDDEHNTDDTHSSWESAPDCLRKARELMHTRGRKYGATPEANINISKLVIRAWVTIGNKKASDLLSAKQRCIVIMCLGCEVIMNISPRSSIASNDNQAHIPDLDTLIPMDDLDSEEDQLQIQPGEDAKAEPEVTLGETEQRNVPMPTVPIRQEAVSKIRKSEMLSLTVSLVHGDVVILEGDDFEYSIKRTGTSVLLIGS